VEKAAARHAGGVAGGESGGSLVVPQFQGLGFAWPVLVQVAAEAV
jgi:hypothetical protein